MVLFIMSEDCSWCVLTAAGANDNGVAEPTNLFPPVNTRISRMTKNVSRSFFFPAKLPLFPPLRRIMCKHILNAQVSIRAPCCKKWFDCPECHAEASDHPLKKSVEVVMACKKCKKCFRKDTRFERFISLVSFFFLSEFPSSSFEESDEYCPGCDNHYVIEAKTSQKPAAAARRPMVVIEGGRQEIADDRTKEAASFQQSLFANVS